MKEYFYNLITGERHVLLGPILRPFLLLASLLFCFAVKARIFMYKTGFLRSKKLPVPVISVGNITWGGTGKTPLVEAILQWASRKGLKAVLLTRGYGNDEDRVISSNIENIEVIRGKRRLLNALNYSKNNKADIFVLDDGFQHLKIKRDIDIVTINARAPFGNNMLLPAGFLREPLKALKRADIVVVSKSDLVEEHKLLETVLFVKNLSKDIMVLRARHRPKFFYSIGKYKHSSYTVKGGVGESVPHSGRKSATETFGHRRSRFSCSADSREKPLEYIKGKRVVCVSALADNRSFIKTIENLGAEVLSSPFYIDHHRYVENDISCIIEVSQQFQTSIVVTTEKDWVKLKYLAGKPIENGIEFLILKMELEVEEDEIFYSRLSSILPG